jgi:crossover junction endodeoxyribonuclease RusA
MSAHDARSAARTPPCGEFEGAMPHSSSGVRSDASQGRTFSFTVQAKIVPAVRMTQRGKFFSRQAGRYLAYKDEIGYRAKEAGAFVMRGPLTLDVTAYAHRRKWDASNVLKGVEDALNKICWDDDWQIVDAHIRVEDCSDRSVDVLDVTVTPIAEGE